MFDFYLYNYIFVLTLKKNRKKCVACLKFLSEAKLTDLIIIYDFSYLI